MNFLPCEAPSCFAHSFQPVDLAFYSSSLSLSLSSQGRLYGAHPPHAAPGEIRARRRVVALSQVCIYLAVRSADAVSILLTSFRSILIKSRIFYAIASAHDETAMFNVIMPH